MDCTKLLENLKKRGYTAKYFDTAAEACEYLEQEIKDEAVGFGGSLTIQQLDLYNLLSKANRVYWHWKNPADREQFAEFTTYITSANGVAETGELVNIDGNGNRLAASLYGAKKLYFICGINKIAPDLTGAIDRARNVASPANAKRLNKKTPCAVSGRCHDCASPERICRSMVIHMGPSMVSTRTEVIIVGETLGA